MASLSSASDAGRAASAERTEADVAKETDVVKAVHFVISEYGRLDVAFNNAGIESVGPLDQTTEEQYRRLFDVNVWGVLSAMKHEITAMLESGGGAIVNTSSIAGQIGLPQASIYVASKHAVEGLTKAVAAEFAKRGIRVNAVAPGAIATEMFDRFAGRDGMGRDWVISQHPVGRPGTAEEIAAAVLYLASDAAKFTTGATLSVDGGWTAV
jgi:NAD(P)-dependent dehydrogenase (short-subunit alcohol dehydrogenase family)